MYVALFYVYEDETDSLEGAAAAVSLCRLHSIRLTPFFLHTHTHIHNQSKEKSGELATGALTFTNFEPR